MDEELQPVETENSSHGKLSYMNVQITSPGERPNCLGKIHVSKLFLHLHIVSRKSSPQLPSWSPERLSLLNSVYMWPSWLVRVIVSKFPLHSLADSYGIIRWNNQTTPFPLSCGRVCDRNSAQTLLHYRLTPQHQRRIDTWASLFLFVPILVEMKYHVDR